MKPNPSELAIAEQTLTKGHATPAIQVLIGVIGSLVFAAAATIVLRAPGFDASRGFVAGSLVALAVGLVPLQLFDARRREYEITDTSLIQRRGVLNVFELEVPFHSIHAIAVRQGWIQRAFGCGDVLVTAISQLPTHGLVTNAALNTMHIRGIARHREVADLIRSRLRRSI